MATVQLMCATMQDGGLLLYVNCGAHNLATVKNWDKQPPISELIDQVSEFRINTEAGWSGHSTLFQLIVGDKINTQIRICYGQFDHHIVPIVMTLVPAKFKLTLMIVYNCTSTALLFIILMIYRSKQPMWMSMRCDGCRIVHCNHLCGSNQDGMWPHIDNSIVANSKISLHYTSPPELNRLLPECHSEIDECNG